MFTLHGESFFRLTNVYLSGHGLGTLVKPFSGIRSLSAANPGFTAMALTTSSYITNNDDTLIINVPALTIPGFYDVIVENPAGYNTLAKYALSGVGDFRVPYKDGIRVI